MCGGLSYIQWKFMQLVLLYLHTLCQCAYLYITYVCIAYVTYVFGSD